MESTLTRCENVWLGECSPEAELELPSRLKLLKTYSCSNSETKNRGLTWLGGEISSENERAFLDECARLLAEQKSNKECVQVFGNSSFVRGLIAVVTAKPKRSKSGNGNAHSRMKAWEKGVLAAMHEYLSNHPESKEELREEWRSDTMLRLARAIESRGLFEKDPKHPRFVGFIREVITNKAAKSACALLRRVKREAGIRQTDEMDYFPDPGGSTQELLDRQLDMRAVLRSIKNPRVREVMENLFLSLSRAEIAEKLGITEDQVRYAVEKGSDIIEKMLSAYKLLFFGFGEGQAFWIILTEALRSNFAHSVGRGAKSEE